MFDLPILAFSMSGTDEFIELIIEEVWGFPDETSYGGGYGAKGSLKIRSAEYTVSAVHYFTTGELYGFSRELKKCYDSLNGIAVLENTERELELKCEFNRLGHVIISGSFKSNPGAHNKLIFEFKTDQTQVKESLSQLKAVADIFGDTKGQGRLSDIIDV